MLTVASLAAGRKHLRKLLFSATLSQNPEKLEELKLFQPQLFTVLSPKDTMMTIGLHCCVVLLDNTITDLFIYFCLGQMESQLALKVVLLGSTPLPRN